MGAGRDDKSEAVINKLKKHNKLLTLSLVHNSSALLPYVIIASLSNNGCSEGLLIERSEAKMGFQHEAFSCFLQH